MPVERPLERPVEAPAEPSVTRPAGSGAEPTVAERPETEAPQAEAPADTGLASEAATSQPLPPPGAEGANEPISPLLSAIFMGIAAFALFTVLIRIFRRGAARRQAGSADPAERLAELREEADARRAGASDAVTAETVDTVTQLIAQLDARAVRLEVLVDRAEAAIDRLAAADLPTPAAGPDPVAARPAPAPDAAQPESHPVTSPAENPVHRRIYELADAGRGPIDIAREVGQPTGQVELILALRRRA